MIYSEGQRIIIDHHRATIRFCGAIENKVGAWIGVEWDGDGRGKNDGSVEGVRYFTCAAGKGSFIRVDVGNAPIQTGVSFLFALYERYKPSSLSELSEQGSTESQIDDEELYVYSVRNRKMAVDFVGKEKVEKKQGQLEILTKASMVSSLVSTIDEGNKISERCPNLMELDLSQNLLHRWSDLVRLANQLPKLEWLKLSENLLEHVPESDSSMEAAFAGLKVLILNKTHLHWADILKLERSVPLLEEIHVCDNHIDSIRIPPLLDGQSLQRFQNLRILDLENNMIQDWDDVWSFSSLPRLERLLLSNNRLSSIAYKNPESPHDRAPFANLITISLEGNPLTQWSTIDELSLFPSLTELRLQQTPLTDHAGPSSSRISLIGRLRKLIRLNGGTVRSKERSDSEKLFLQRYLRDQPEMLSIVRAETIESREIVVRRLWDLARMHPDSVPSESDGSQSAAAKQSSGTNFINLTFRSMAPGSATKEPVTKRIPLSITIDKLKILFYRLFGLDVTRQRLYFTPEDMPVPQSLTDDFRDLDYYGVTEGCVIIMEEA
eukprot:TRINITY_DN3648_c0_g1_i1.p1 TRINITY_DN3648_c0_g1~~TRINITY_DN3648_c0_g1_i1.p1  ORF type:complete len:550 (-),score=131.60 TRINITY_DN3648_c0_g1_i1:141-1790(-)